MVGVGLGWGLTFHLKPIRTVTGLRLGEDRVIPVTLGVLLSVVIKGDWWALAEVCALLSVPLVVFDCTCILLLCDVISESEWITVFTMCPFVTPTHGQEISNLAREVITLMHYLNRFNMYLNYCIVSYILHVYLNYVWFVYLRRFVISPDDKTNMPKIGGWIRSMRVTWSRKAWVPTN